MLAVRIGDGDGAMRLAVRQPRRKAMSLIHCVTAGSGQPPIVFVHGFACSHSDWDAQVAHLAPRHRTVAVDLRGHGESPGTAAECSIERYGTDVADIVRALNLLPVVLVGHSMGCRVVVEAAARAPESVAGIVLVDGSQFAAAIEGTLRQAFGEPDGFRTVTRRWFQDMFAAKSDPAAVASVVARAGRLAQTIGETVMLDLVSYDVTRFSAALARLGLPVMAIQTTYSNERRERRWLAQGQTTPYLDMLRAQVPSARIEIIPDTGHFPQIDEPDQTNALLGSFIASLPRR